ncbi:MAG: Ig-like domain-containing protein [Clostridium sp.]|uniref:Ig-like domain-containing protein n=1 Tax=Clostridium sp. TaxID=1506 RepID=UPI002FCC77CC
MKTLLPFINKKIQIITEASPPAGKPPNITGTLIYVDNEILKLRLKSKHHDSASEGIYFLKSLLGFIPIAEEDSGGCEKEENPLTSVFSESLGKRVNLILSGDASIGSENSVTGTLIEVTSDIVRMQLDQTNNTTKPQIGTFSLTQVVGVIDLQSNISTKGNKGNKGTKGGKGGKGGHDTKNKITLQVKVEFDINLEDPVETKVDFIKDDIVTTISTIGGVATWSTEARGKLVIKGESIPGFITPSKEIMLTTQLPFIYETLTYNAAVIPTTGITLFPSTLSILPGDMFQLTATIEPLNASNQDVIWKSDTPDVATVNNSGMVTAHSKGIASISGGTNSDLFIANTIVTVTAVNSIVAPSQISALPGQVIVLPRKVNVILSNDAVVSVPVTWWFSGSAVGPIFEVPYNDVLSIYSLTGTIEQTSITTSLDIIVNMEGQLAIPVTGIELSIISDSIYVGSSITIEPIISPDNATTKDVIWSSSDSSIASVENGKVTGISPGFVVITATTVQGGFKAYCQISVSSVPEIDLIYSVESVYKTREEVVINVENLVANRVTQDTLYYIKVEEKGSNLLLGVGVITLTPESEIFNLYAFTNFLLTDKYNKQYFVSMSTDENFPKSDEQTLTTNFKIGSVVPIVDPADIKVDLTMIGGNLEGNPNNIIFILAREIDKPIENITWRDYAINPDAPDDEKLFTDEVKLKGKTDVYGVVQWETPKETLKIGGYVLLEVTPDGYYDNLNLVNPESSDGELLKAIHLTRDSIIIRHIINTSIE